MATATEPPNTVSAFLSSGFVGYGRVPQQALFNPFRLSFPSQQIETRV